MKLVHMEMAFVVVLSTLILTLGFTPQPRNCRAGYERCMRTGTRHKDDCLFHLSKCMFLFCWRKTWKKDSPRGGKSKEFFLSYK
ncbi:hypothetical protein ScPMuIL_004499, partial [Solemya velum]